MSPELLDAKSIFKNNVPLLQGSLFPPPPFAHLHPLPPSLLSPLQKWELSILQNCQISEFKILHYCFILSFLSINEVEYLFRCQAGYIFGKLIAVNVWNFTCSS